MASIKIDSKIVVEACIKTQKKLFLLMNGPANHQDTIWNDVIAKERMFLQDQFSMIDKIRKLAECSTDNFIYIDHNDFQLIGEYLPKFNKTTIRG